MFADRVIGRPSVSLTRRLSEQRNASQQEPAAMSAAMSSEARPRPDTSCPGNWAQIQPRPPGYGSSAVMRMHTGPPRAGCWSLRCRIASSINFTVGGTHSYFARACLSGTAEKWDEYDSPPPPPPARSHVRSDGATALQHIKARVMTMRDEMRRLHLIQQKNVRMLIWNAAHRGDNRLQINLISWVSSQMWTNKSGSCSAWLGPTLTRTFPTIAPGSVCILFYRRMWFVKKHSMRLVSPCENAAINRRVGHFQQDSQHKTIGENCNTRKTFSAF